ncbi:hypothetical protein MTO96_020563 [Rhipicephalus appendiculatus]
MDENLGSDHFIIETIIPLNKSATKIGKAKIADWQAFRKDESVVDATIDDIDMWTRRVVERAEKHTRVTKLSRDTPVVGPHLLHLWEARRGLAKRWQRKKCNCKLKIRISKLVKEAQEYSERMQRKNWHDTCNKRQGTLRTKRTWAILKVLLAKKETKSSAKEKVHRLMHNHPGEAEDIVKEVKEKFLGTERNINVHSRFDEYRDGENEWRRELLDTGAQNLALTARLPSSRAHSPGGALLRFRKEATPLCTVAVRATALRRANALAMMTVAL